MSGFHLSKHDWIKIIYFYMSEGNEDIYCYTLKISFSSDRAQNFFAHVLDPQEQESTIKILSVCPCTETDRKRLLQAKVMDRFASNFACAFIVVHTTIQYKKFGILVKTTPPRGTYIFLWITQILEKNVCRSKLWTDMLQILHAHLFQCILQYNINKSGIQTKLPPLGGLVYFLDHSNFRKKRLWVKVMDGYA